MPVVKSCCFDADVTEAFPGDFDAFVEFAEKFPWRGQSSDPPSIKTEVEVARNRIQTKNLTA
jgi:hypothetical protein